MENELRKMVKGFLERSDAECFIGYERSQDGRIRPSFVRRPEDVGRLVWNRECFPNLTVYLPNFRQKKGIVGIGVKGCDARALRMLIQAHQVDRSKVYILGLPCEGLTVPGGEGIAERCYGCIFPENFQYDATLGPMNTPNLPNRTEDTTLSDLSPNKRREFWELELEKCIRCDACRNICYACFCPECIFESARPRWLSRRQGWSEKFFFHSVRALHLAGRCIECGECERACPAGVRLMILNRQLQGELENLFGFKGAGVMEEPPPLLHFSGDDPDPFDRGFV